MIRGLDEDVAGVTTWELIKWGHEKKRKNESGWAGQGITITKC